MNALLLKPQAKQLFEVQPQHSHPKLSLRRVLWVKLLRWIDKASPQALWKTLLRASSVVLMGLAVFAPQFLLGFLTTSARWNGYRIPLFLALLVLTLNAKRLWRGFKRIRHGGNQHTFHGIPSGELASWLIERRSFTRDEAIPTFGLSQGKWLTIARELEQHGVLVRGPNNARVLRDISLQELVRQLRDNFPLVWSDDRKVWAERNGTFERWAMAEDFSRRKLEEETARKERKLERVERKLKAIMPHAEALPA